jgi:hypothetical protein
MPLTVILHGTKREALAKLYKGRATVKTFANRTQANAAAAKLGAHWGVVGRRPFYVVKLEASELPIRPSRGAIAGAAARRRAHGVPRAHARRARRDPDDVHDVGSAKKLIRDYGMSRAIWQLAQAARLLGDEIADKTPQSTAREMASQYRAAASSLEKLSIRVKHQANRVGF